MSRSEDLTAQIFGNPEMCGDINAKDNAILANILNQFRDIKYTFILALSNFREFTLISYDNFFFQ